MPRLLLLGVLALAAVVIVVALVRLDPSAPAVGATPDAPAAALPGAPFVVRAAELPAKRVELPSDTALVSVVVVDVTGGSPAGWEVYARLPATPKRSGSNTAGEADLRELFDSGYEVRHLLHGAGSAAVELPREIFAEVPQFELVAAATDPLAPYQRLTSTPHVVDGATRGTVTLVVASPTWLDVRIEGARPLGRFTYSVVPLGADSTAAAEGWTITTPDGSAAFAIAPDVTHSVRVTAEAGGDVVETRVSPVPRGTRELVVLRFPGSLLASLPAGYAEVALAGRIAGPDGSNEDIWAAVDDRPPSSIFVRSDGTFEYVAARGQSVVLHASSRGLLPRFEPELSMHPFGTRGVVLRRLPAEAPLKVKLRMLADESGAVVPETYLVLSLGHGAQRRRVIVGTRVADEVEVVIPPVMGIEYSVLAQARRDTSGVLFPKGFDVPAQEIRLPLGLRREFTVLHCALQTAVPAVEVLLDERVVARGDASGHLLVELEAWPERLVFHAPGFDATYWPTQGSSILASRSVSMCPAD